MNTAIEGGIADYDGSVLVTASDGEFSETRECEYGDDYEQVARALYEGADYGNGDYRVHICYTVTANGDHIDEGSFNIEGHTEEPPCPNGKHHWTSKYEGGLAENPGVWLTGGTSMVFTAHCLHCGTWREKKTTGRQYNPGECNTTRYGEPDEDWVAAHCTE